MLRSVRGVKLTAAKTENSDVLSTAMKLGSELPLSAGTSGVYKGVDGIVDVGHGSFVGEHDAAAIGLMSSSRLGCKFNLVIRLIGKALMGQLRQGPVCQL